MEKKDHEERPKVVVLDKLDHKSYVTFNFAVEPSGEAFKGYSATVVFRQGEESAEGVLDQLVASGMAGFALPEEINELIKLLPCEDPVAFAKRFMSERVREYDSSEAVNNFVLGGIPMWLDKSTRSGLKLRLEAEQSAGKEQTTLWYGTKSVTLPVARAMSMLNRLEIYASESYDVTQGHLAAIDSMESVEDVLGYEIKIGYPEMLNF